MLYYQSPNYIYLVNPILIRSRFPPHTWQRQAARKRHTLIVHKMDRLPSSPHRPRTPCLCNADKLRLVQIHNFQIETFPFYRISHRSCTMRVNPKRDAVGLLKAISPILGLYTCDNLCSKIFSIPIDYY